MIHGNTIAESDELETSEDTQRRFINAAKFIREWQEAQRPKLSDAGLIGRFDTLGSTKTFKRVLGGDTSELKDIESKWLPQYEAVVRLIQAERDESAEPIYLDLPMLQPILADATRLMSATGNRRLMLIEGDTGHGKTCGLRAIQRKFNERAILCEADESWFRASTAVGQLSLATGAKDNEAGLARQLGTRINELVAHLRGRRMVLVDEFQHCGGGTLNVLKTLINKTNSVFVVAGMKTLLDKLSASSQQEARQLFLNRLQTRHTLTGPKVDDAEMFFSRRLKLDPDDDKIRAAIEALIETRIVGGKREPVAAHLGGLAFLRNVADTVRDLIGKDELVDAGTIVKAANLVKKQAIGR